MDEVKMVGHQKRVLGMRELKGKLAEKDSWHEGNEKNWGAYRDSCDEGLKVKVRGGWSLEDS